MIHFLFEKSTIYILNFIIIIFMIINLINFLKNFCDELTINLNESKC